MKNHVKMLSTAMGSEDGLQVSQYIKGREYHLGDALMASFVEMGIVELVKPETGSDDNSDEQAAADKAAAAAAAEAQKLADEEAARKAAEEKEAADKAAAEAAAKAKAAAAKSGKGK